MKSFVGVAIVFAFVAVISVRGDATKAPAVAPPIKCYKCDNCTDPFPEDDKKLPATITKEVCAAGVKSCFKYFHSDKRVQRGCSPKPDECPEDQGKKLNLAYCYTCFEEDCNSARRVGEVSALPLLATSVASLMGLAIWNKI